jgi:DNA-binding NarL/FixJ family response regulator
LDKIRVILANGNPTVVDLERLLTQTEEVEVAGIARSGLEAIQSVKKLSADILVLELRLPDLDASEVIRRLQDAESTVRNVVLSEHVVEETILYLLKMGISGYITYEEAEEWLVPTLRAVMQGAVCLSPMVRERLSESSWGAEFQLLQS